MSRSYLCICIALGVLTLGLGACKQKKKLQKADIVTADSTEARCRLDFKTARTLSRHMQANEFVFDWLSAKANVEYKLDEQEENFDIRLAMRHDSAILVSIQYLLGMQVAKVLITKDTVVFVNYVSKTYFKGDFAYINEMLNADLDYEAVQAVLFGNSAAYHDDDERLKSLADRQNCVYLLSTERKRRRLRRLTSNEAEAENFRPRNAMQTLTLRPDDWKILKNEYIDPTTDRKFVATYSEFKMKDSVFAPYRVDIDIVAQKKATLKIEYVRIELGAPQRLSLNIPARYDAIQIERKEPGTEK